MGFMLNHNLNIYIFSNVECPSAQELGDNSRQNYPDSAKFSQTFLFSSVLFELFANPKQKPANSFFRGGIIFILYSDNILLSVKFWIVSTTFY